MHVLKILFKAVVFLIGMLFLASGLFCGAIGTLAHGGTMVGLLGIGGAAIGGLLLMWVFRKPPAPETPLETPPAGEGDPQP